MSDGRELARALRLALGTLDAGNQRSATVALAEQWSTSRSRLVLVLAMLVFISGWGVPDDGSSLVARAAEAPTPSGLTDVPTAALPLAPLTATSSLAIAGGAVTGYSQVTAGGDHSCGLKVDGSVLCWGRNSQGELGPVPTGAYTQISAGTYHTCGVKSGGSVACWGDTTSGKSTPLSGQYRQVAAGPDFTCGLKTDGSIVCWGRNDNGQSSPVPAGPYTQVAVGTWHACGRKTNGSVACWGYNGDGQAPTSLPGPFTQVSAGPRYSCGIKGNGTLTCWGKNDNGQTVPPGGAFSQISATSGGSHACGLRMDRNIICWGDNTFAQSSPVPPGQYSQVGTGDAHTCGLKTDGSIVCWGSPSSGQLGPPAAGPNYVQLSAATEHTCGLKLDGSLICWGANTFGERTVPPGSYGQVGAGRDHTCAVKSGFALNNLVCWGANTQHEVGPIPSAIYTQVSVGEDHSCGLTFQGIIRCWGHNDYNEAPDTVVGAFKQVSARFFQTCGLKTDNNIACWGLNAPTSIPNGPYSQVSAGKFTVCGLTTGGSVTCAGNGAPQLPGGPYTQISAGDSHVCAIQTNGSVVCAGGLPVAPPGGAFRHISAGSNYTCGIKTDSNIICWGGGSAGNPGLPVAAPGGPYSVAEGVSLTLNAGGNDPGGYLPLSFGWDLDNNGIFETPGASPPFSAAGLDGPSTRPVRLRVCNSVDFCTDTTVTITIGNAPPTANFTATPDPNSSAFTLAFAGAADPAPADVAAGFTYAFDCGDGAGLSVFGPAPSRTCVATTLGPRTVHGSIRDKDGGHGDFTATPTLKGWRALLHEDFEGDFLDPAWFVPQSKTSEATWGIARCPGLVYAGRGSGWPSASAGDCSRGYRSNQETSMISLQPFDLASAGQARLRFQLLRDLRDGAQLRVQISLTEDFSTSVGGLSWTCGASTPAACSSNGQWQAQTLDLANVPGLGNILGQSKVWLRFFFFSPNDSNTGKGPFLDDVVLEALAGSGQTPGTAWSFAEGYTGEGFDEFLTIMNPGPAGTATITYFVEGQATPVVRSVPLPAASRTTVVVHQDQSASNPGGLGRLTVGHATRVTSTTPVVVERPMYFRYGAAINGGHDVLGATALATSWSFAEGYTGTGFDEFLTIMNPGAAGTATITYFVEGQATPVVRSVPLPAASRTTVVVHQDQSASNPGGLGRLTVGHSTRVETSVPTVVERPMYFTYGAAINGGHDVLGARAAATSWSFAEGYTGTGFDEFLTIMNPGPAGTATITYFVEGASSETRTVPLAAGSRTTVVVHAAESGANRGGLGRLAVGHSTRVETSVPTVVERPMYFTYGAAINGGHDVLGGRAAPTSWSFAEGYTGDGFDEFLTIMNPGPAGTATITYFVEGQATPVVRSVSLAAASRTTVVVHEAPSFGNPGGLGRLTVGHSTRVTSTTPVVVERPMYFRFGGAIDGGHDVLGFAQ